MVEMPVRVDQMRDGLGGDASRALVICVCDTLIPASTSTLPSGPVSTATFPPEPSSTLMLLRNLCTVIGEAAALSLIRLTRPRASA